MSKKDNSTLSEKVRLRRRVLEHCAAPPMVLETHGGYGRIFERTWWKARAGVVIEKDDAKVEHLCRQRPTWAVYQGDCETALEMGLAKTVAFDVVDLDPYGQPFNVLAALSLPGRKFPDEWHLVVNDGTRNATRRGANGKGSYAWTLGVMKTAILKHGPDLYPIYLDVARECVEEFAAKIGFEVVGWTGYYTGAGDLISHYWAILRRRR